MKYLESGSDFLAFVSNHSGRQAAGTVSMRTAGREFSGEDLQTGGAIPIRPVAGGVEFDVALGPHGVRVLRMASR